MTILKNTYPEYGAFVLRISLGVMWISHASLKWFVFTMAGLAGWLESIGFSGILAWPLFLAEITGGLLILVGFYGRYVSVALLPILAVAISVHFDNGWVHTSEGGGWEYPLFLLASSLVHFLIGDGKYALKSK